MNARCHWCARSCWMARRRPRWVLDGSAGAGVGGRRFARHGEGWHGPGIGRRGVGRAAARRPRAGMACLAGLKRQGHDHQAEGGQQQPTPAARPQGRPGPFWARAGPGRGCWASRCSRVYSSRLENGQADATGNARGHGGDLPGQEAAGDRETAKGHEVEEAAIDLVESAHERRGHHGDEDIE